ncbi:MAG: RT0821/Lpp0805 family surface protein [Arenicellales bacterium]
MKRSSIILLLLLSVSLVMSGCTTTPSKQQTGAGVGAVLGAALGYGLGQGHRNKDLAIALGALFGAVAGDYVGAQMDERDRLMAAQNLQYSLELTPDGTTSAWQNPNTGHSGHSYPTRTMITDDGTPCREFTSNIMVGGEQHRAYGTACRQADGSWKIVNN